MKLDIWCRRHDNTLSDIIMIIIIIIWVIAMTVKITQNYKDSQYEPRETKSTSEDQSQRESH